MALTPFEFIKNTFRRCDHKLQPTMQLYQRNPLNPMVEQVEIAPLIEEEKNAILRGIEDA